MNLRKRKREQMEALVEAAAAADASAAALPSIQDHMQPEDAAAEEPRDLENTAIIDAVISTAHRVDIFDTASLKALRLTCKALRDVVDDSGVFSSAKFNVKMPFELKGVRAWAANPCWMARTRSLLLTGHMPRKLPLPLLEAVAAHRPPLSTLELHGVGEAGELLLKAPLATLRHLTVKCSTKKPAVVEDLLRNTSFTGLRSLNLENMETDATALASLLDQLSELKTLTLCDIEINGRVSEDSIWTESSLSRLELLSFTESKNVDGVGLFTAQGPPLPALRVLHFRTNFAATLHHRPWLSNLTTLMLSSNLMEGPEVTAALSGGPLKELSLNLDVSTAIKDKWDWNGLEFPQLTRLKVAGPLNDAVADIARAKMPALTTAAVPFTTETSAAGVRAFNAAFPTIKNLQFLNEMLFDPPYSEAAEVIGREVVPRMVTFSFNFVSRYSAVLAQRLLPTGPAGGAPAWPRLRALDLKAGDYEEDVGMGNFSQPEFFTALARAAPHCPALTSLNVIIDGGTSIEAVDAFVAAAKEVQAWPILERVWFNMSSRDKGYLAQKVQQVWPEAVLEKWETNCTL